MICYTVPMVVFEDIQDVEEWLAPYDYAGFWTAVAPWRVFTGDERAHYDKVMADGKVDPETVLFCLKDMACMELRARFGLKDRTFEPEDAQYLRRVH